MTHRFGRPGLDFALGVEEELIAVDPGTGALSHTGIDVLDSLEPVGEADGAAHPDTYSALVELASPPSATPEDGVRAVSALRARLRAAGGTFAGAGIHPDGAFGDVLHVPAERYAEIADQLRGLLRRTPTCALHVHVGMPDPETAVRAMNGLREWLPLLQALAANSPFWHGRDSGLATARAQLFRGYPRADIPRAYDSYADWEATTAAVLQAGDLPDYTFLWADIRLHPHLGTVEVRAMDAQSSLRTVLALTTLVHGLARVAAESRGPWSPREALMESSFRAARDGTAATLWHDGALRPVAEIARDAVGRAGVDGEEVERLLREGNGADRQRAAFARGGMRALLRHLMDETASPL